MNDDEYWNERAMQHISEEALNAFANDDLEECRRLLGLPPWVVSPTGITLDQESIYPSGAAGHTFWPLSLALRRQLLRLCGREGEL